MRQTEVYGQGRRDRINEPQPTTLRVTPIDGEKRFLGSPLPFYVSPNGLRLSWYDDRVPVTPSLPLGAKMYASGIHLWLAFTSAPECSNSR